MKRYIVMATCMEYMKVVHLTAKPELAARAAFKMIFPGLNILWRVECHENLQGWTKGRVAEHGGY